MARCKFYSGNQDSGDCVAFPPKEMIGNGSTTKNWLNPVVNYDRPVCGYFEAHEELSEDDVDKMMADLETQKSPVKKSVKKTAK